MKIDDKQFLIMIANLIDSLFESSSFRYGLGFDCNDKFVELKKKQVKMKIVKKVKEELVSKNASKKDNEE